MDKTQIRNAATIILIRDRLTKPSVLMGQRGASAAFMPNKFVFPGGALDQTDHDVDLVHPIEHPCHARLASDTSSEVSNALTVAAIRELWEETGLILGVRGEWKDPPTDWMSYAKAGFRPSANTMKYVFRALTPPGRPRRFDARFFLADADQIAGDLDDFSAASDELSHLQWIELDRLKGFDLPFITKVVIAEVAKNLASIEAPQSVPFFKNSDEGSLFLRIGDPLAPNT